MHSHVPRLQSQQGVALLTILLMVVLATVLTMSMLNHQQRVMRQTDLLFRQDQAFEYALAGEHFLIALLKNDEDTSNQNDTLQEAWAQPVPLYPVEDGTVSARLMDQSGLFNLNNLYHDGKPDVTAHAILARLLVQVGYSADLADAVLDWEDPDDTITGASGAENSVYQGLNPPRYAANQPFSHVEELMQVQGFNDPKKNALLFKQLTAVPVFSPININTASPEVLAALDDAFDAAALKTWSQARDAKKGLTELNTLWTQVPFKSLTDPKKRTALAPFLALKSMFYQGHIKVTLSNRVRDLTSDIYRKGAQLVIYRRSFLPFESDVLSDTSLQNIPH